MARPETCTKHPTAYKKFGVDYGNCQLLFKISNSKKYSTGNIMKKKDEGKKVIKRSCYGTRNK